LGPKQVEDRVTALRCGLDHTLWQVAESREKCAALLGASPDLETVVIAGEQRLVRVLPFDLTRAHELYTALLGPAEDLIKGKHLLIVPSGSLTSLPFHVLVTEPPKPLEAAPADSERQMPTLADYRAAAWLGARQPITVLPSVASLKSLRQFAKTSRAGKPYLGLGNPLLDGPQDHPQWGAHYRALAEAARQKQRCVKVRPQQVAAGEAPRAVGAFAGLFRGTQADIEAVRSGIALPETADELCEVGRQLGAPEEDVRLGTQATEASVKEMSETGRLADYRVLHFATHGALAGQVRGSAEPGLIFTPPAQGTSDEKALERDDGFLTASEIATLKLDADWVILSACNTAGAGGDTGEALSGMARAFFYAGARALLVSHWEVGSDAAVKLTTKAFAELKSNPGIGRAEAFRRSMHALIRHGAPHEAHPTMWAPFVVVGEGGAPEAQPLVTSSTGATESAPGKARAAAKKTKAGKRTKAPDWRAELWRQ
jgi:CHAT domain-containing protein